MKAFGPEIPKKHSNMNNMMVLEHSARRWMASCLILFTFKQWLKNFVASSKKWKP
jgi:hypothetical protein